MIMVYLDYSTDFMQIFYRAFLAKNIVDNFAPVDQPVKVWTTAKSDIELDAKNQFLLIEGRTIFRYDFLWIANVARFVSIDIGYRQLEPDHFINDLIQHTWEIKGEVLELFLYPWSRFPVWSEIGR